jgi:hypothetical protein
MMRAATIAVLMSTLLAPVALGQARPPVRRVVRTSFPFAITPSLGLGYGATRVRATDPADCPDSPCVDYGSGSGWQARVDLQVPLGRTLGFEVGGQLGRQASKVCQRGSCSSPDRVWAYRGTASLLWRFKPRAPVFFGVGGAVVHYSPNPVFIGGTAPTTELGVGGVLGVDLSLAQRAGIRVAWRNYFLIPETVLPPPNYVTRGMAWESSLLIGARLNMGK